MKFSIDNARKDLGYYNNMTAAAANSAMLGTAMEAALRQSSAEGLGGEMLGAMVGAHKARSAAGK
jgi:3-hydroxyisobutyrate dehydrogenase-like beta-hydroxyacid dehydrogenase